MGSLMAGATVTNNQATLATSSQYVKLPGGLFGSYTAVSVEAWVTTEVNSDYAHIFQFGALGNSNKNSIIVFSSSSNTFKLSWVDGAGSELPFISAAPFNSQKNVHVVMTVSTGDYARLYIHGVLKGTTPAVVNPIPPPNVFYISNAFDTSPGLKGSVNEFRIWGGTLSATDIATRNSHGPGTAASNIVLSHVYLLLRRA